MIKIYFILAMDVVALFGFIRYAFLSYSDFVHF